MGLHLLVLHTKKVDSVFSLQVRTFSAALLFFFFFGQAMWLTGSQFPDQGLNPGPSSESTESQPLDRQGIPLFCCLITKTLNICEYFEGETLQRFLSGVKTKLTQTHIFFCSRLICPLFSVNCEGLGWKVGDQGKESRVTTSDTTLDSSEPCLTLCSHLFFLAKLELLLVTGDE